MKFIAWRSGNPGHFWENNWPFDVPILLFQFGPLVLLFCIPTVAGNHGSILDLPYLPISLPIDRSIDLSIYTNAGHLPNLCVNITLSILCAYTPAVVTSHWRCDIGQSPLKFDDLLLQTITPQINTSRYTRTHTHIYLYLYLYIYKKKGAKKTQEKETTWNHVLLGNGMITDQP